MTKHQKQFSARLKELEDEFEHPEDFFRKAYEQMQAQEPEESYEIKPQTKKTVQTKEEQDWMTEEEVYGGKLAVDVFQLKDKIVVKAVLAGVKPEDLEVNLNNDTLTIKGKREKTHKEEKADYFISECYWGGFSRSIILPVDVKQDEVEASFEQGILTITLPISKRSKHTKIEVKEIKK